MAPDWREALRCNEMTNPAMVAGFVFFHAALFRHAKVACGFEHTGQQKSSAAVGPNCAEMAIAIRFLRQAFSFEEMVKPIPSAIMMSREAGRVG